ncbi:MAG: type I DNA topoisomerase [Dehalococcoidia bacterium]|nr:type I DNA topoisomerase [Dehalococcoidia bacterium]
MAKQNLVIVESPAKARTLERMLGKGFKIKASMGHVRDLPKSRIGVDPNHDFAPKYVVSRDKSKTVKELKEAAMDAPSVYLATDPDREGEAIAWHLSEVIGDGNTNFKRVTFHEITRDAIEAAFKQPRGINMNLVNAQQARRVVDRLMGYKLSPLLWRKVRRGLSAGRVQSVAVKIVVDREREIQKFVPVEYWTLCAELLKKGTTTPSFRATLAGLANGRKLSVGDEQAAQEIKSELEKAAYSVLKAATKQAKRSPAPPFITSTLQQEAWRRFKFTAKRTMALAQQLYEGLPVGDDGQVGLITYMRTDSTHVSPQALAESREYIMQKYGVEYLPAKPRVFAGRVKRAQEAHEAIRPTGILREPHRLKQFLTTDLHRLYQLIWQRMVASQMAEAVFDNTTVDIEAKAAKTGYLLRTQSSVNVFPGFITLYSEQKDEEDENDKKTAALPKLEKGDALTLTPPVKAEQNFTQPPPRYTEATLIKTLEQNGIGRPSTYAPIMTTIQDREYVKKSGGTFVPTEVGFVVTDLLVEHFGGIINEEYTARMEDELDKVASNDAQWVDIVRGFYQPMEQDIAKAGEVVEKVRLEDEKTGEDCPDCGQPLVIKSGRFGKFIACSNYPDCKYHTNFRIKTGVPCPDCPEKGDMVGRFNKKGKLFYGCSAYPKHKFAVNGKPVKDPCPRCGKLLIDAGKGVRCTSCDYRGKQAKQDEA